MTNNRKKALAVAIRAARMAGKLMRQNDGVTKKINEQTQHDIKLELDVRCQKLIEKALLQAFPKYAVLGEEGISGNQTAAQRWVVDPIDGTVNFTYGIPHACVSIALQEKNAKDEYHSTVGVVYDPFCDEFWSAVRGEPARMNGKIIHVSDRKTLDKVILAIGFAKSPQVLRENLPIFNEMVGRVRKMRMMGAAALSLTYVASGRFDAYIESGVRLWDVAAGSLIIECAGGEFWSRPVPGDHALRMIASNGLLRPQLERVIREVKRKNK